jgi:hypothetical protein
VAEVHKYVSKDYMNKNWINWAAWQPVLALLPWCSVLWCQQYETTFESHGSLNLPTKIRSKCP